MARWDWYQSTLPDASPEAICRLLSSSIPGTQVVPGYPKNGYLRGADITRNDERVASVWWGGNPGVHVLASGEHSPTVCQVLRESQISHRITRADACEDFIGDPELFDSMATAFMDYASANRIKIENQGDWHNGQSRTLYIGSRKSPVMIRLYEKGHQLGTDPTWVRLEVVVRPKGEKGFDVAEWQPGDAFGASRWLVSMLESIGWDHLKTQSIGTQWAPSDTDRARAALVRQYGATLEAWAEELGGWDQIPEAIEQVREESQALKKMVEELHR